MTNTAIIVECVKATPGVTLDRVAEITGVPKHAARKLLLQVTNRGQFSKDADGGYSFNPDFVPYSRGKASNKAARREGKQAAKPRTYGDFVKKIREPAPVVDAEQNIGSLMVEHARSTFDALQLTVDLTDAEPSTVAAFKVHAQALRLLGGGV